jgi:hypothetical protein
MYLIISFAEKIFSDAIQFLTPGTTYIGKPSRELVIFGGKTRFKT